MPVTEQSLAIGKEIPAVLRAKLAKTMQLIWKIVCTEGKKWASIIVCSNRGHRGTRVQNYGYQTRKLEADCISQWSRIFWGSSPSSNRWLLFVFGKQNSDKSHFWAHFLKHKSIAEAKGNFESIYFELPALPKRVDMWNLSTVWYFRSSMIQIYAYTGPWTTYVLLLFRVVN